MAFFINSVFEMKKYIISGFIGFGISVLCIVPPIIHFVTGPLGPLIGGFFGGMKTKAKWNGAIAIGLTIGISLALFLTLLGSIILSLKISIPGMMNNIVKADSLTSATLLKISLFPFSLGTILGTLGAYLGGKIMNKEIEKIN